MRTFAWMTFITGLLLSGIAGLYSVFGLAMIFAGAYRSVIALASILEVAKLVAVSWMYRYRHLTSRWVRAYFYMGIGVLMLITSMGIFGYLTRAHVTTESGVAVAELTLQEIASRESALRQQKDMLAAELSAVTAQSGQLVTQLGSAQRLAGTNGAVNVQRQTSARRQALITELSTVDARIADVQQERIRATADIQTATADVGPLRYVAQILYGTDDLQTIRKAVTWLTVLLMVVFDPMAIMLLIAANILFATIQVPAQAPAPAHESKRPTRTASRRLPTRHATRSVPAPSIATPKSATVEPSIMADNTNVTDVPQSLQPQYATNRYLAKQQPNVVVETP